MAFPSLDWEGLSQTWAAELAESGVRVNWVDPGNMNTKMHRLAEPDEDPAQWANRQTSLKYSFAWLPKQAHKFHGQRYRAQELENPENISAA